MNKGEPVEKYSSPPEHLGGVVTLLFTDIVGSTALKQQLGIESVSNYSNAIMNCCGRHSNNSPAHVRSKPPVTPSS